MSQHFYSTQDAGGTGITIMMGYDRPLGHYFLVVERDGTEDPIYTNLRDDGPFHKSLWYYRAKLDELGLAVPSAMYREIDRDQKNNIGNRRVLWDKNGIVNVSP